MCSLKAVSHLVAKSLHGGGEGCKGCRERAEAGVSERQVFHPGGVAADAAPFNKACHKSGMLGLYALNIEEKNGWKILA